MVFNINKQKINDIKLLCEGLISEAEETEKLLIIQIRKGENMPIDIFYNEIDQIKAIGYIEILKEFLIDRLKYE
jgi:hypothetical protein